MTMTVVIVKRSPDLVPSDARRKMIESAAILLATRGLEGTSFSDVLERSGAPRGSIYHHFPEGKDELVDAAIALAGDHQLLPGPLAGSPRSIGRPGRLRRPGGDGGNGFA